MAFTDHIEWVSPMERRWVVGCSPARLVHRMVGRWPGNNAVETACRNSVCLHGEDPIVSESWGPAGGRSFDTIEDVPEKYIVCLKCVAADETVE